VHSLTRSPQRRTRARARACSILSSNSAREHFSPMLPDRAPRLDVPEGKGRIDNRFQRIDCFFFANIAAVISRVSVMLKGKRKRNGSSRKRADSPQSEGNPTFVAFQAPIWKLSHAGRMRRDATLEKNYVTTITRSDFQLAGKTEGAKSKITSALSLRRARGALLLLLLASVT